ALPQQFAVPSVEGQQAPIAGCNIDVGAPKYHSAVALRCLMTTGALAYRHFPNGGSALRIHRDHTFTRNGEVNGVINGQRRLCGGTVQIDGPLQLQISQVIFIDQAAGTVTLLVITAALGYPAAWIRGSAG